MNNQVIEEKTGNILISTDRKKLNYDFIHSFLTRCYWCEGISKENVIKGAENSLSVGVYINGEQVGFCRIVSDYIRFAYLMDVFIIEEHRGKGLSKLMINFIMSLPGFKSCRWLLATRDAHGLYEQFGFKPLPKPERFMVKEAAV